MYSLLLLSSLLHITTCTVYTVTPDDHYYPNTTCHHCHNLQHYLLNVTKYFTSNTQLLFLPGLHHLHTDLIVQNVHNISLIGSTANGTTLDTVIQCNSSYGIVMTNITNLTMKNMVVKDCIKDLGIFPIYRAPIAIENCVNVILSYLQIYYTLNHQLYFLVINVLGKSRFSHISCNKFYFIYNEIQARNMKSTVLIDHLQQVGYFNSTYIHFSMNQHSYEIAIQLVHITFQQQWGVILYGQLCNSILSIMDCDFLSNRSTAITIEKMCDKTNVTSTVKFINCKFMKNEKSDSFINIRYINVIVINCIFNSTSTILQLSGIASDDNRITVVIKNTKFVDLVLPYAYSESSLVINCADLLLEGMVIFHNITYHTSIITLLGDSTITIHGRIEFSNNSVCELISFDNYNPYIQIKEPSIISISHNQMSNYFITFRCEKSLYCIFQYLSNRALEESNFSILFYNNQYEDKCKLWRDNTYKRCYLPIIDNCYWSPQSIFNYMIPTDVNNWFIKYNNNSIKVHNNHNTLCACNDQMEHDCSINDLGYLYPGEVLIIFLYHKNKVSIVTVEIDIDEPHIKPCVVNNFYEQSQSIIGGNYCSELKYRSLKFEYGDWCVLFLRVTDNYVGRFYIRKLSCPPGFVEINKICECDPLIVNYGITECDINNQSILRSANTWITATAQIPYSYHITEHCRFYYCLPHSSYLNFSTPNSQCQFSRSGLLCGHCQQGLSTVFSSSQCQHCSNIYLLLIIPIAIIGLIFVFLLFYLNLTITNGTVNAFILYANIVSINYAIFFPQTNGFTPAYTFISLANLDLGIQTCFYNGMDDYAKMWLQLAFPFYLIFIATLIVITSRYSTTIQRLTARRALPVLATLFLLSYTKILRIVSNVLFFYSTITHLPSKHTTIVWSVDANVSLFGVRFTILFIVCLILFLILVPFNVILLFTRTLSRFRFINRFKPLLDAYQGPYKISYYNYTGIQLLIRIIFFALSSLERNINLVLGATILSVLIGMHGITSPLKNKWKNFQEVLYMINLQTLYVVALYDQQPISVIAFNVLLGIAAFHLALIVMYHYIMYSCNNNCRTKLHLRIVALSGWIKGCRLFSTLYDQRQLNAINELWERHNMRNEIPEAVNYHRCQETLLNEDY